MGSQLFLLLLLPSNHVFPSLRLNFIRPFLHVDHLGMLLTFLLQADGFTGILILLKLFVVFDRCLLVLTVH